MIYLWLIHKMSRKQGLIIVLSLEKGLKSQSSLKGLLDRGWSPSRLAPSS